MRNLEIKARVASLAAIRARLAPLTGARHHARLRQTDHYFVVPRWRLKLREIVSAGQRSAELIAYERPDRRAARTSRFVRLPAAEPATTRRLLTQVFGVSGCVRKRREVWLYRNARIHLDRVTGLGAFIEIEVVVVKGLPQARRLMDVLTTTLGIRDRDLVAVSYADLLEQ